MIRIALCLCAAALAGCGTSALIADLEHDKVIVQASGVSFDLDVVKAEAARGCAIHNRTAVGPLSNRCDRNSSCYTRYFLFACKPR